MEVMLDRILQNDDGKRLGGDQEGLLRDNLPASSKFTLVLETHLGHGVGQKSLKVVILLLCIALQIFV